MRSRSPDDGRHSAIRALWLDARRAQACPPREVEAKVFETVDRHSRASSSVRRRTHCRMRRTCRLVAGWLSPRENQRSWKDLSVGSCRRKSAPRIFPRDRRVPGRFRDRTRPEFFAEDAAEHHSFIPSSDERRSTIKLLQATFSKPNRREVTDFTSEDT